jgi:hypothetical protein
MMFNANLLAFDANYSNLENYAFNANYLNLENYAFNAKYLNLENYACGLPINKIAPTLCIYKIFTDNFVGWKKGTNELCLVT